MEVVPVVDAYGTRIGTRTRQTGYIYSRNVRSRTDPAANMYRPPSYAKTKSSYGRKKPITASKALATAKRHNFKVNVERVMQRRVEVKKAQVTANPINVTSYFVSNSMNVASMIPYNNITQGTGQSNRIGNRIRTRSCKFSFVISPNSYNATLNNPMLPQEVIIYFGVVKNSKAIEPTSTDFSRLFQNNGSQTAPNGTLLDLTQEFNTDYWTIRKVVRYKVGTANYGGTGSSPNDQSFANNDFKLNIVRTLDLTSICPKQLMFNDTVAQPTNDGLFMWVQCVPANGSQGSSLRPLRMEYCIRYSYEDA